MEGLIELLERHLDRLAAISRLTTSSMSSAPAPGVGRRPAVPGAHEDIAASTAGAERDQRKTVSAGSWPYPPQADWPPVPGERCPPRVRVVP